MRFKMIAIDDERVNQFATKKHAQQHADAETALTGRHHRVVLANTFRGLETYKCYTAIMKWRAKP